MQMYVCVFVLVFLFELICTGTCKQFSLESPKPASFSKNEYSGDVVFALFSTAPAHGEMVHLPEHCSGKFAAWVG